MYDQLAKGVVSQAIPKTKFLMPDNRTGKITRQRLNNRLDQGVGSTRLIHICAPAGYGKTTAVADWLGKCELPVAWLSLDYDDNIPSVFWNYLCMVLDDIVPDIRKDTEYVLSSSELLSANIHINILIDRLAEVRPDFVVVMDDIHLITDQSIMKGLAYLIDYMPPQMHLILISRTEPNLDLARYRIKWQMQRIDEKDLRFQKEEILRFYHTRGLALETDEIEMLEYYTEGWIASLIAIALTLESRNKIHISSDCLLASRHDIEQYLKDEVISAWSDEKQIFAMKTSILDTLSEDVCNAVTDSQYGSQMLAEIYADNGFLTRLDEEGGIYKFHYLFKDFLHKLLLETGSAIASELHVRAGVWYREKGIIEKAIEHFLNGGAYEAALKLIEYQDVHLMYDSGKLLAWIERLPESLRDNSFKVALICSRYYIASDRLDMARIWRDKMKTLAALPTNSSDPEVAAFCRNVCILNEINLLLREGNLDFVTHFIAAMESYDPKYYKMPEFLDFNTSDIYCYRCPISMLTCLFAQDADQYETSVNRYRTMLTTNPGYKPLVAGEYLYETNQLDEALPFLLDAVEEAQQAGCPGALVPAMADIARIKRARGDTKGALAVLDECAGKLQGSGKTHWMYLLSAFRCRLYIDIADAEKIEKWVSSCKLSEFTDISKIREFELMVYARVQMFKDCLQDAEILLQRLLNFTKKMNRPHSMAEVLNMLALLEYKRDRQSKAFLYLDQSLALGSEQKYVRSYLDEAAPMKKLLSIYINSVNNPSEGNHTDFAACLLDQMKEGTDALQSDENLLAGLTAREFTVLKLMRDGQSNVEIASSLFISLDTVKKHVSRILKKLEVKSRTQAVIKAGEINI